MPEKNTKISMAVHCRQPHIAYVIQRKSAVPTPTSTQTESEPIDDISRSVRFRTMISN
jgi:hypothetical protein